MDLLVLSGHHQEMIRIFDVGIGIVQVQPVHVEQVVACDALGCKLALTVSELRLWYA
jgi:phosphoribosylaminoimidazole (AIR) synthetase